MLAPVQFITIVSTDPPEGMLDNVPIDKVFTITFSEDIHPNSLTPENFKLYTEEDYSETIVDISYSIVNNCEKRNIVVVTTTTDLNPNTNYILVVYGDSKLQAGRPIGVVSINGKVLEANWCLFFTTGVSTHDNLNDCVVVVETFVDTTPDKVNIGGQLVTPVVITDSNLCIANPCDSNNPDSNKPPLQVISTFPQNGEINVCDFLDIEITFNDSINWTSFGIYIVDETGKTAQEIIDEWIIVRKNLCKYFTIERHDLPFDCDAFMIASENASYKGTVIITKLNPTSIILDISPSPFAGLDYPNSEYTITVHGGKLRGNTTTPIETTKIKFLTLLSPMYASIDQLDNRLPSQFELSDYDKYKLIAEYSEMIVMRYNGRMCTGSSACYYANKFLLCSMLNDLMNTYRDSLGGLKQREQFGLNIVYNTKAIGSNQSGPYDSCVADSLNGLDANCGGGVGVSIGIKSGNTAWYMGRRRGIRTIYELQRDDNIPDVTKPDIVSNNYNFRTT